MTLLSGLKSKDAYAKYESMVCHNKLKIPVRKGQFYGRLPHVTAQFKRGNCETH
jgi:hypothetical protein